MGSSCKRQGIRLNAATEILDDEHQQRCDGKAASHALQPVQPVGEREGFQGKEGQQVPEMTPEYVNSVSERYIELYEKVTGHKFEKAPDSEDLVKRIENNVLNYLKL